MSSYDWRTLADRYRPTDPDKLYAEIRRQRALGLKPRDISTALRIDMAQVLEALRVHQGTA